MNTGSDNSSFSPADLIKYGQYPIDQPQHKNSQAIISQIKAGLAEDGCAVVRNFLSEEGLQALLSEAEARKPQAYYSKNKDCNVYLNEGDASLPDDYFTALAAVPANAVAACYDF